MKLESACTPEVRQSHRRARSASLRLLSRRRELPRVSASLPVLFATLLLLLTARESSRVLADLMGDGEVVVSPAPRGASGNAPFSLPGLPQDDGPDTPAPGDPAAPVPSSGDGTAGSDSVPAVVEPGTAPGGHRPLSSLRERSFLLIAVNLTGQAGLRRSSLLARGLAVASPRYGIQARTPRAPRAPPGG